MHVPRAADLLSTLCRSCTMVGHSAMSLSVDLHVYELANRLQYQDISMDGGLLLFYCLQEINLTLLMKS